MDILNFDHFRAGKFPGCLNIEKLYHSEVCVIAEAYTFPSEKSFVQFRKHRKDQLVALFSFNYEVELSEFWQNSDVIWDSRNS
jgi:hypothetical protein